MNRKKRSKTLRNCGKIAAFGLAGAFLASCSLLEPLDKDKEKDEKKSRFEFLRDQEKFAEQKPSESLEQEQVTPRHDSDGGVTPKQLGEVAGIPGGKPAKSGAAAPAAPAETPRFYDDFTLLNGDEELSVSLVFNSAPLLDALPAFADVLGFNFVADSDLKSVVTLNINSKMTRRELWNTFDRMLALAGAGVTVEDSLLKIMALPKLAAQPGGRNGSEVYYYPLKDSTAKDVVNQIKPFLGKDSVCVELTRPNAILICDATENLAKVKQLLDIIDQSARRNWPRLPVKCANVLPSKVVEELQSVLPVLGFTVTKTTDKIEQPGAVQLFGVDRLQMLVVSAATQEAIDEIRKWVEILDSSDSLDQERVFVYKVGQGKADQLAQALSIIYNTQGASLTIDTTSASNRTSGSSGGTRTTSNANATTSQLNTNQNIRNNTNRDEETNTKTDQTSSVFETPVRIFADGVLNRLVIRTTPRTYASIKALLDRLDVVPSQVLLQVLVVEVTLTESNQFGLEFSAKGSGSGVDSLLGTNYDNLNPFGETKDQGFSFLLNDPNDPQNKFGYIRAMAGNTAIKVISSPQLLVTSHTQALIQVGSDVPTITSASTTTGGEVVQNYTYKSTGVILTITPQITSTNLISLDVRQELSNAIKNTTSSSIDSPEITQRVVESSMTVANGRTMVIGGLIQEKRNDTLQSVPLLNDIPILRRLLGSTDAKVERSEILVLITGYIINEKSPVEELIKRYDEAIISLNQFDETLGDKPKTRTGGAKKLDTREFWE